MIESDVPTATEFVPETDHSRADEGPGVRHLQATGDGGLEIVSEEPHDDEVLNHVFVCDHCGHAEDLESDMGFHLETAH